MVCLPLMLAVVIINCAYGRPPLPPLPMKDGCYFIDEEVELFRVENDAVILSFPKLMSALKVRNIAPPAEDYLISKANVKEVTTYQGEGRVQQQNKQLWFLPALASDSGKYTCTYRNETYCITGSIELHVYEPTSVNMEKLSHPIPVRVGEDLEYRCPSLSNFNKTDSLIKWYKNSSITALQREGKLKIPGINQSHLGFYTCQLKVRINNQQYKVSRIILLQLSDPAVTTKITEPTPSMTSDPGLISSSTVNAVQPPVIVSPPNGAIFESPHGSGVELFCLVLTECQMTDSTEVTWMVNGQSVESSYLDKRALQGGRRVTRVSKACQIELRLIAVVITEEDQNAELKCVTQNKGGRQEVVARLRLAESTFTWLVVAVVAVTLFLIMVSIFLYVLFKPKKKNMDYFLARQNSTF